MIFYLKFSNLLRREENQMALSSRLSQILRFLGAGGVSVLLYYLLLSFLKEIIGIWYIASSVIAFIVSNALNFVLHKFWTFQNKTIDGIHWQAGKFTVMKIAFLFSNTFLLYALVEYLNLWYLLAQLIASILLTGIGYLISRRIFAD